GPNCGAVVWLSTQFRLSSGPPAVPPPKPPDDVEFESRKSRAARSLCPWRSLCLCPPPPAPLDCARLWGCPWDWGCDESCAVSPELAPCRLAFPGSVDADWPSRFC